VLDLVTVWIREVMPLRKLIDRKPVNCHTVSLVLDSSIVDVVIDSDGNQFRHKLVVLLLPPELLSKQVTFEEHHLEECGFFCLKRDLFLLCKVVSEVAVWVEHLGLSSRVQIRVHMHKRSLFSCVDRSRYYIMGVLLGFS